MSVEISLQTVVQGLFDRKTGFTSHQNNATDIKPPAPADETSSEEFSKQESSAGESNNPAPSLNRTLDYQINPESKEIVVRIVDPDTGEVVRQIPQEEFLRLTQRVSEFNHKAFEEFA